ncbi:MAG: hypothetical protein LBV35_02335 [Acinetobacter sp.]|jgi:hypothetical protein|uniref:hypothetical protein n=1 Tax=Acinetobacter sp. TaxID=472 RepID=UPI00283C767F|nr:hypothetical protein [Acinetobacter sp.]MDR3027277.1 hypothetical protein [Acinetobacter sp.]
MSIIPASEATKISNENHVEENLDFFQSELEKRQKAALVTELKLSRPDLYQWIEFHYLKVIQ